MSLATDNEIRGTVDRLAVKKTLLNKGKFKLYEQAVGFIHEPFSILHFESLKEAVKPASQYCHDWMHCIMVGGVMNVVLFHLFKAIGMGIYSTLYDYVQAWQWPKFRNHAVAVRDLFLKKRQTSNNKAKTFKALASELLSLYPVLAMFLCKVILPSGDFALECAAFMALCGLVDLLMVANLGKCTPDQLKDAVRTFIDACKAAGWEQYFIPKFHWLCHLHCHLKRFGCLPTCWVHERKHRVSKRYSSDITNTQVMERSVLGEVVAHNLHDLKRPGLFNLSPGLVEPIKAKKPLVDFVRANIDANIGADSVEHGLQARITPAGYCCRGDIALVRSDDGINFACGEIVLHLQIDGQPLSLVNLWQPTTYDRNNGYAEWAKTQKTTCIPTRDILTSVMKCDLKDGGARTLVPWLYRRYKPVAY